jgi:hypothetical protein
MQIGPSNPLTLLPGNPPQAAGQAKDYDAGSARAAAQRSSTAAQHASHTPVSGLAAEPEAAGVVLHLQAQGAAVPSDLVYANTRKNAASQPANREGVLLAPPASPAEVKSQAFVHHAVNAMRAYADEQERLTRTDNASGAVQRLAARFKAFA